ncbi:hypothetical protein THRCLA_10099 [Thraustotheca clavata]|uniref:Uncharacterized protein n=1 Tax=Thraustotheca clavata TaxID=74557 RepID=A0A1V9YT52_9STRA|nr:hypothetical protein THRCLA_10099 [Thraustotheca clavata]
MKDGMKNKSFLSTKTAHTQRLLLFIREKILRIQIACEGYYKFLFGPGGLFSRKGSLYEVRLLARQCIIIPLQFTKGVDWSLSVDSPFVCIYGVILAFQCISIPPLAAWNFYMYEDYALRERCRRLRIFILVLLIILDLLLSIVIPLCILAPVVYSFLHNSANSSNPAFDVYAISVVRGIMVGSLLDLVTFAAPLLLVYNTVQSIQDANVSSFLWNSIITAASPLHHLESLRSLVKIGDLDGRLSDNKINNNKRVIRVSTNMSTLIVAPHQFHLKQLHYNHAYARRHFLRFGLVVITTLAGFSISNARLDQLEIIYAIELFGWLGYIIGNMRKNFKTLEAFSTGRKTLRLSNSSYSLPMLDSNMTNLYQVLDTFSGSNSASYVNMLSIQECSMAYMGIPTSIKYFTNLWSLTLESAQLFTINSLQLPALPKLVHLSLRDNQLSQVPTALAQPPPLLSVIDLSWNQIGSEKWPEWTFPAWKGISQLYLMSCNLNVLPQEIINLEKLTELDVTNNSIAVIPTMPENGWQHLNTLRLGGNKLQQFSSEIFKLPSLRTLTLAMNELQSCTFPTSDSMLLFTLDGNPCCNSTSTLQACHTSCSPMCDAYYLASPSCISFCESPDCISAATSMPEFKQRQRLRWNILDAITLVCFLYASIVTCVHAMLAQSPFVATFLSVINPVVGLQRLYESRTKANHTAVHLRLIKPLQQRQRPSTRKSSVIRKATMRIKSIFRLRLRSGEVAPDLRVIQETLVLQSLIIVSPRPSQIYYLRAKIFVVHAAMVFEGLFKRFFGLRGVFTRKGDLYEIRLLLREAITLPLQFLRGWNWSHHVDSSLVSIYGIILAIHCILIIPLVMWNFYNYRFSKQKDQYMHQRNYIVLAIICLDLLLGVIIPTSILFPIFTTILLNPQMIKSPTFGVRAISVIKSFMVVSILDLITFAMPLLLIYATIQSVHDNRISMFLRENVTTAVQAGQDQSSRKSRYKIKFLRSLTRNFVVPTPVCVQDQNPNPSKISPNRRSQTLVETRRSLRLSIVAKFQSFTISKRLIRPTEIPKVGRIALFIGISLVGIALGLIVFHVALRSMPDDCTLSHADAKLFMCQSNLRPWHFQPFFQQSCFCQSLMIHCDGYNTDNLAQTTASNLTQDFLSRYPTEYTSLIAFKDCSMHAPLKIPSSLIRFDQLWFLLLDNAGLKITDMDLNLNSFSKLIYLALQNNKLTQVPQLLAEIPSYLTFLLLSGNNFTLPWPEWVGAAWGNIEEVYLDNSQLTEFPPPLLQLPWLITLDITSNHLKTFPPIPADTWPHLTTLKLGGNQLNSISQSIFVLPQLATLTLAQNQLQICNDPPKTLKVYTLDENPCCVNSKIAACSASCAPLCDAQAAASPTCFASCNISTCSSMPFNACY